MFRNMINNHLFDLYYYKKKYDDYIQDVELSKMFSKKMIPFTYKSKKKQEEFSEKV